MRSLVLSCGVAAATAALVEACRPPAPCVNGACAVACPRDAVVDASGRCACRAGDLPVLGACLPPPVADGYCGAGARATADAGCRFLTCGDDEADDADRGCVPIASLSFVGRAACPHASSLVVASGRAACVRPDAACPAGAHAEGAACVAAPPCPPGTLRAGACRPLLVRRYAGEPVVDVAAWAAVVLGTEGGPGSPDLCRPLELHPDAFGVERGQSAVVTLGIALTFPDADVTRVSASVEVAGADGKALASGSAGAAVAAAAVTRLVEPLRGLAGLASAARAALGVHCTIASL